MELVSNQKIDDTRTLKVFGIPIFSVTKSKTTKQQRFLGGVIRTDKDFYDGDIKKSISFLGFPFYKYTCTKNLREYFLFDIKFRTQDLGIKYYKRYEQIFRNHDDIYIMHANIGESFVFLKLAKKYFEKKGSKKPLIVGLQGYHVDLVKMICPDVPVLYTKRAKISLHLDEFKINEQKFHIIFPKKHFDFVEDSLRDKNATTKHFIKHILNRMELDYSDFSTDKVNISERVVNDVSNKMKDIGLNLDKFVIFAPEANTCEEMSPEFWQNMKQEYESKGFDIFCNTKEFNKAFDSFKWCSLTITEVYALVCMAKEVVALRSGLIDLLSTTNTPMKIYYTQAKERESFNHLTAQEIFDGFRFENGFNKNVGNIEEFVR